MCVFVARLIHISEATKQALEPFDMFTVELRGEVEVKVWHSGDVIVLSFSIHSASDLSCQ